MSVTKIPAKVKYKLWASAAGRCEYCNQPLWEDLLTKTQFSTAYIAHIVGEKPKSARYNRELSSKLKYEFSNLMLLCDTHHRLIDVEDVVGHPVEKLREIKRKHEERVHLQTSLTEDKKSHILHYGANIGKLIPFVTWSQSKEAMYPTHYPAESQAIEISLKGSSFEDREPTFWNLEQTNLQRQFSTMVQRHWGKEIYHLSVFAFAPQPLLIELGRLLSDISGVEVYQHQKEPQDNWRWSEIGKPIEYLVQRPASKSDTVALNVSLSASIDNSRITSILGDNISIWTLTIDEPYNDFLKSRSQLMAFRECFRKLLNDIKFTHGQNQVIHVFLAAPISVAIEMGRVWMPKADLPLRIYDQNSKLGGFVEALSINSN